MSLAQRVGGAARNRALVLLLIAYIFNFVDRQIIGVLAVPIKAEMKLDDSQLGLMGGVAFALFYATLALPLSWLADRRGRVRVIAASVALWSLATAACGLTQNYWQLFAGRMAVGIGEAGGVAPSYSLISDYFQRARRGRALAVFSLGIPLGSALGIFFGAKLASALDWRTAFLVLGLAGLPAALALRLLVPEPTRPAGERDKVPPLLAVLTMLARIPIFWLLSLGAASGSILGYGLIFWLPALLTRSFGLSLAEVGPFYGSIVLVGGVAGIMLGGSMADRLGPTRPAAYAWIPAGCLLAAAPLYLASLTVSSHAAAWLFLTLAQMLGLAWLGPVATAVQLLVPRAMRSTASAAFLLIVNLVGIGLGVWIIGRLSVRFSVMYGQDSLWYSIAYGLGFYVIAAFFYGAAAIMLWRQGSDRLQAE